METIWSQESDSNDNSDLGQQLTVRLEDAGGGVFFVIETPRWAFDEVSDLVAVCEAVAAMHRLGRPETP